MSTSTNSTLQGYVYKNDVSKVGHFCEQLVVSLKQSLSGNIHTKDSSLQVLATRLLDRAFGESVTGNRPGPASNTDAGYAIAVPWVQCKQHGGWLRSTISSTTTVRQETLAVDAAAASLSSNSISKANTTAITLKQANAFINKYNLNPNAAKLVALFSANDSELMYMFYTIFYDFELKLSLLPRKTQFCLLNHPACETIYTNSQSIYSTLFKNKGVVYSNNGEYVLKLQPFEYFLVCLFRYPSIADDVLHSTTTNSTPANLNQAVVRALHTKGALQWLHGSPYLVLFHSFLEDFVVYTIETISATATDSVKKQNTSQKKPIASAAKDSKAELFIRLAVDILIESNTTLVKRDFDKVDICRAIMYNDNIDDRSARGMLSGKNVGFLADGASSSSSATRHPLPEDVLLLDTNDYAYWTIGSLQCIYLLVAKALGSPSLCDEYRAAADIQEAHYSSSLQAPAGGRGVSARATAASSSRLGHGVLPCACPSSVEMLQQPLFDMLRIVFSRGDSTMQCSSLTLAGEIWMAYIQPWRAQLTMSSGTSTHRSGDKFSEKWLPYVAANLHFYTTLFVSFIKCSSRLDYRTSDESGMMYYNLLESVVALFTDKGLRQAIDRLVTQWSTHSPGGNPPSARKPIYSSGEVIVDTSTSVGSLMGVMLNQHHALFPDRSVDLQEHAGIVDIRNYEAFRSAIIRLIQANCTSAKKQLTSSGSATTDAFAAIRSVVVLIAEGMAGNAPLASHGPTESQLESTIQKLCDLANLGPLAVVASKNATCISGVGGTSSHFSGERDLSTGKLTPLGKERILSGKSVCKLEDYLQHAQRDVLDAPLRSDEVADVASLMIYVSKNLNERFDLPRDKAAKYKTHLKMMKELCAASTATYTSVLANNFRFNVRPLARIPTAILTFAIVLFQFMPTFSVDVLDFFALIIFGIIPFLDEKTISQNGKVFSLLFASLRLFCRVQGMGIISFLVLFSIAAIAKELA